MSTDEKGVGGWSRPIAVTLTGVATHGLLRALDDSEGDALLRYLADAWPQLPPHIRAAIITLVDAALPQQEGGQS